MAKYKYEVVLEFEAVDDVEARLVVRKWWRDEWAPMKDGESQRDRLLRLKDKQPPVQVKL